MPRRAPRAARTPPHALGPLSRAPCSLPDLVPQPEPYRLAVGSSRISIRAQCDAATAPPVAQATLRGGKNPEQPPERLPLTLVPFDTQTQI